MYILSRDNQLYFNRRIAGGLLRISLRTRDKWVAQSRAMKLYILTDKCISESMNYSTIKTKARQQAKDMHNEWLLEHFAGLPVSDKELEQSHHEEDPEQDYVAELKRKLILGELLPDEVEDGLAFILYKAMQDKTFEEWRNPEHLLLDTTEPQATATPPTTPDRISDNVDAFLADKQAGRPISDKTVQAYRDSIQLFIDVMGNRTASELTYKDGTEFRDKLSQLPANRKKKKLYRDKSITELLTLGVPSEDCLKSKTISDTIIYLKNYLSWLVKAGITKKNPFEGVTIDVTMKSYTAYTIDDLNTIFHSPLFVAESEHFKRNARRSYWWLLVIAAYTGARISELVQLTTRDIISKDGVLCFSLIDEEEEKRLKSKAARRIIPIHSKLHELGLVEYAKTLRVNGKDRLLSGIIFGSRYPGQAASSWYNERYREKFLPDFKAQRKVFHSFRHTFIQSALKRDVDLTKLQAMVGHEPELMGATKTYKGVAGSTYTGQQLSEQIERVCYEGLELGHMDWREIPRD